MNNVELKRMTVTAIFIAIGVLLAPFVSFPFGGARVFPLQHLINVLLAVLVGWRYSTAGAIRRPVPSVSRPFAWPWASGQSWRIPAA